MKKKETVELAVDVNGAELAIEDIIEGFGALKSLAGDIGAEISRAFLPLQNGLHEIIDSMFMMTDAIVESTSAFKSFMEMQEENSLAQELKDAFDSVLGVIGTIAGVAGALLTAGVAGSVVAVVAVVMALVAAIVALIIEIVEHWDEISQAFTKFFTQTIPQLWEQFVAWITGIAESVEAFLSDAMTAIGEFFTDCWEKIVAVWALAKDWFTENVITPVADFFVGLWNSVSSFAVQAWETIKGVFSTIGNWVYQHVVAPVAGFFTGLWDGFTSAAAAAWEGVKGLFSSVGQFFKDIFTEAWSKVVNVFSAAGAIFVDIKDAIVGAFKTVVNGIIKGLNNVIAVPFNGINKALNLVKGVNILGIQPFSGLKSISVPEIPYLAQGAVLPANKPFLAVVGDQKHGTNIEAPLSTIQEAVADVLAQQGNDIHIRFTGDLAQRSRMLHRAEHICPMKDAALSARGHPERKADKKVRSFFVNSMLS